MGKGNRYLTFLPSLNRVEWSIHLTCWLAGLIIINWLGNEITIGIFRNETWGMLIPGLYGTLLNAFLFYSVLKLLANELGKLDTKRILKILQILLSVTLLESIFDGLISTYRGATISMDLTSEILFGNLLMNFFFFLVPSMIYGVLKYSTRADNEEVPKIMIQDGHQKLLVYPTQISHIESDGNYVRYCISGSITLERNTLSATLDKLPEQFVQCHKSFIVNTDKIKKLATQEVLVDQYQIPVGRKYRENLRKFAASEH